MAEARKGDPDRLLKETLFQLLSIIQADELNFVDRDYGGVLVETEDGPKSAYLRLSFEEPPTPAQLEIKKHIGEELEEAQRAFEDAATPGGFNRSGRPATVALEYITICPSVVGNPDKGFEIIYAWDGQRFPTWKKARANGFEDRGSDDFNICVVDGNTLVDFRWMDEPMNDPEGMADIAEQNGFDLP